MKPLTGFSDTECGRRLAAYEGTRNRVFVKNSVSEVWAKQIFIHSGAFFSTTTQHVG